VTAAGRYAGSSHRTGRARLVGRARAVTSRALGCAVAVLILLVLALSSGPTPASGATLTLTAVADSYVRSDQSGTNFGTSTQLASNGASTTTMISYLRFDVTGLAGPPASATLSYVSRSTGTTRTAVRLVTGTWSEDTLTYANRPAYGSAISSTAALTAGTWATADVSSVVTGNGSYSFALTTTATATRYADSRESANPPQLLVTDNAGPTPAPTTATPSASATPTNTASASASGSTAVTASTTAPATSVAPSLTTPTGASPTATSSVTSVPPSTSATPTTTPTPTATKSTTPTTGTPTTATTTRTTTSASPTATTTAPPPADPVIALAGDIACDPDDDDFNGGLGTAGHCHMKTTADLAAGMKPATVLTLGDHQYNSGSSSDFLASYDKSWRVVKGVTKPVVGNHEYGTSGASGYFGYFKTSATGGSSCVSNCRGYYSFNLGSWHIVAINTECSRIDGGAGCATGSPQQVWLKNDLASHTARCTLVFGHRPRWSSNSFASADIAPLVNTMVAGRADVYVAGHSHSYERFAPMSASGSASSTGITEMVVGTGGSFYTGFGTVAPNSQVRKSNVFGVLKMTLKPTSYTWSFAADPSTPFSDSGSRSCT
jgi:hypothetical protein